MLSRVGQTLRSSQAGKRMLLQGGQQFQRRNMGGGGHFMETNKFGERLGEVFGTVCWLWVFHRFSQDGKVLLGMEHPWEHGGGHGHDSHGHGPSHGHNHHGKEKKLSPDELTGEWEKFAEKAIRPGDDDDDDDEEEEEDDEE